MQKSVSLNLLVSNYQCTKNELIFNEIYRIATNKWPAILRKLANKYYIDEADVESIANYKLYEVVLTHDNSKGDFVHNLSRAIRRGCIDLVRKKKLKDAFESLVPAKTDEDGNEVNPLESLATANAEEEIIEHIQKKSDQRQLIADLLSFADDDTRESASAYMMYGSFGEAAKLLGTNKMKISRQIKRLANHFDANQFGDYRDYFVG